MGGSADKLQPSVRQSGEALLSTKMPPIKLADFDPNTHAYRCLFDMCGGSWEGSAVEAFGMLEDHFENIHGWDTLPSIDIFSYEDEETGHLIFWVLRPTTPPRSPRRV